MNFDVIIVGAGPAGIFSAIELADKTDLSILLLDKGPAIDQRKCPASRGLGCVNCDPCSLLAGWGGAGAFSDGKLTLSTEVGGWLNEYCTEKKLWDLLNYVDSVYLKFGATKNLYGTSPEKFAEIERKASFAGLKLVHQKVRHMGTEKCAETLRKMRSHLEGRVDIRTRTDVKSLLVKDGKVEGVETTKGEKLYGKYVIVAPGRIGAEWLKTEA
ncbi:MAG: FAD-dependent oxidoreductase, partial [Candidatus Bathyarchaeota archaeon]|nr:FAD-dependent oxidoreductase [Candidatus Bathyarchaeota archaeon]